MSVLAIDGPAGAGKSTIARRVAERLGWDHVDTGAMYRAIALAALRRGLSFEDEDGLTAVADAAEISFRDGKVYLDGEDVSQDIREDDVTRTVSMVSAHRKVRAALVPIQRACAQAGDVVIEGRDIGSAVFPDAELKVWLSASMQERAARRLEQLGRDVTPEGLALMERSITERDERDASRTFSPMKRTADSVEIDTTSRDIEQVTEEIVALVRERVPR